MPEPLPCHVCGAALLGTPDGPVCAEPERHQQVLRRSAWGVLRGEGQPELWDAREEERAT